MGSSIPPIEKGMLNLEERRLVYEHAYVPEHLPDYVEAVTGSEAHLHGQYLCFSWRNHLTFIGYPLKDKGRDIQRAYESACERFRASTVALIAPQIWLPPHTYEAQPQDSYYRLDLPPEPLNSEVAYMVRRARRELRVAEGIFRREHNKLVNRFLSSHDLTPETREIYKGISRYLKRSLTAHLIEARTDNGLVAFSILDTGSSNYAFYLFNFRSMKRNVPGASDLLFQEMVNLAQREGKRAMNLGLGIHPGIRRFKEKWGGTPFLPCQSALVSKKPFEMGRLADKL